MKRLTNLFLAGLILASYGVAVLPLQNEAHAAPEDFTTYTEVDPLGRLSATSNNITIGNLPLGTVSYISKDFGANYFNGFTVNMTVYMASNTSGSIYGIGIHNVLGGVANSTSLEMNVLLQEFGGTKYIRLNRGNAEAYDNWLLATFDTPYYLTLNRYAYSDNASLKIFSNPSRTSLITTLYLGGFGTETRYRYIEAVMSQNSGAGSTISGWVANMTVEANTAISPSVIRTYGDSITAGLVGPSDAAHRWANLVAANTSRTLDNQGLNSLQIADMATYFYANSDNYGYAENAALLGYNDMRASGTNVTLVQDFINALYPLSVWEALPQSSIIRGVDTTTITYTGNWTNTSPAVYGNLGRYSSNVSDTAQVVVGGGSVIYVSGLRWASSGAGSGALGTFRIETRDSSGSGSWIDQGIYPTVNFSRPSILGIQYEPSLIRLTGFTAGQNHDVKITTITSNSTDHVYLDWIGTNNATSRNFYLGDCLPMTQTGYVGSAFPYNQGSNTAVDLYNSDIFDVFQTLRSDGLNVQLVDSSKYYDLTTDVAVDDIHPNDSGNAHIAQVFEEVINATSPTVVTNSISGLSIDRDGITTGNFSGNVTSLGSTSANIYNWVEWGTNTTYGTTTSNVTHNATGNYLVSIPTNLTANSTYHYRYNGSNPASTYNGADTNFTISIPTVTTVSPAITANTSANVSGNITNMGVASGAYVKFKWGLTASYGNNTTSQNVTGTGIFSTNITGLTANTTYHYQAVTTVGGIESPGSDQTFITSGTSPTPIPTPIVPLATISFSAMLISLSVAFVVVILVLHSTDEVNIQSLAIAGIGGTITYYVVSAIINLLF